MRFEHPELLWFLLLAVPALTAFLWWAWRRKRALIAQFVRSRLLANLTVGVSTTRQKARLALLVASVALLIVALARPQWGFDWEEARQRGLDIIVAIDTSRSMLAEDVAPNRLERAKLAAMDLKKLARMDRLGLVAFAGSAFLQCPLSTDDEAFRQSVNALDVNIIPQGGTALAEAIQSALSAFKEKSDNHKVLVLFTDGEDHDGSALAAAKQAAKDGLRIFTVGVGTPNGELLRLPGSKGRSEFIKDTSGNVVKSRLDEQLLRQMAQSAEGFYLLLSGANTMDVLYERGLAPLPKAEFSAKRVKRPHERYQWLLGLTMVLLLVEMFLPERKIARDAGVMTEGGVSAGLPKAVALLLLLAWPGFATASPAGALKKYENGKYESALLEYQRLIKKKPGDPRLEFNAGAAAYQAQDFQEALKHLNSSLLTPDVPLQQRAYYNLGNTQYRVGEDAAEPQKKQEVWEQAVTSYESALKLNPADEDAKFNLDLVKTRLEELKKQQQQQQSKDGKDDKDKKGDQKKDEQSKNDQKQDGKKSDEQKQQEQQKQEQQKQQENQEAKKDGQKQDEQKQAQQNQPDDKSDKPEDAQAGHTMMVRMTPKEAQQLLDAQKGEEKAMIFQPQLKTNRNERVFKDW